MTRFDTPDFTGPYTSNLGEMSSQLLVVAILACRGPMSLCRAMTWMVAIDWLYMDRFGVQLSDGEYHMGVDCRAGCPPECEPGQIMLEMTPDLHPPALRLPLAEAVALVSPCCDAIDGGAS